MSKTTKIHDKRQTERKYAATLGAINTYISQNRPSKTKSIMIMVYMSLCWWNYPSVPSLLISEWARHEKLGISEKLIY